MKAMIAGFAAMVVIGVGAYFVLGEMGFSAADTLSSPNVRLD
ncbi:hypothetical protein [Cognatishimia sp. F0-27]|nr:hypothetical protein [Cognatishimia sp. F0-27]